MTLYKQKDQRNYVEKVILLQAQYSPEGG